MDVATLRRAMQPTQVSDATLAEYLPHYLEAMRAAQITTVRRAAAFDSQLGHESAGFKYMAEIEKSNPKWNWDRTRYRGRGPIQLTWEGNYRKFGQWCQQQGYIDDPELFVKDPELVEQPRWGFLAASWYWLNAGPRPGQINGFADAGDILAVSRCVNGWVEGRDPNGFADRKARWNQCLAMGDDILPTNTPPRPGDQPMPVSGDPTWLEDVLRPVLLGNRLKTIPGWKESGVGGTMGNIWGVIWHHTGNANASAQSIRDGRPDLSGPLSQLHIAQDGTVTIVAVGPCNHAGKGSWAGLPTDDANSRTIGIECAWPKDGSITEATQTREEWPAAQVASMVDVGFALAKKIGNGSDHNISHSEWARFGPAGWRQGKWDPGNFNMSWFRDRIAERLAGQPAPQPPPAPPPLPVLDRAGGSADDQLQYRWNCLGGQTPVEALAQIRDKVCGTQDAGKPGVKTL